ncbi:MAG: outer membrane lipoprotein-sorting protein [Gammaproteobacteria bacterium]|nr:outer membrane lipoprotein-sorting protein [Gammaproteobacteria bacterium]
MKKIDITATLTLILIMPMTFAATLPSGDEIANNINARDEGVSVSRMVVMEMTDKRGKQRIRKTRGFRKYFGDEKRTVIYYLTPKNVKDTAFMTYDYADASIDDDQWLYLPAMRKVRRISASDRGDYFLGTDFTYEEIKNETRVSIEDYTRKTIGEAIIDGHRTFIIESTPVDKATAKELGYSKVKQWIDAKIWMARKTEFTSLRNKRLKTTYTREIKQVQGIWTAHLLTVENHKTGHSTKFSFSEVDYQTPISDDLFTARAMRRGL